jgi:DNA-binding GntR family transcriptional regulator
MTPGVMDQLGHAEDELERAVAVVDQEGVVQANIRFHQIISEHAGNREAAEIVDRNQILLRAFRAAYGFDASRLAGVVADHHSMMRAFADRDADGAAAIAGGHAAKARNDLIATIRAASAHTNHKSGGSP